MNEVGDDSSKGAWHLMGHGMHFCIRGLSGAVVLMIVMTTIAAAAPPASCAGKFVGTWVYSGGTTVIAAGGMAYPKCPMCVATQTWTCQGNTYLFSNSGPPGQFSATLSADGRQMFGSGTIATRVGGASSRAGNTQDRAAKAIDKPQVRTETARESRTGTSNQLEKASGVKSASCSDITGTSSKSPAATHCQNADRALYAARQIKQSYPQVAAAEYKKAATAARTAGDTNLELSIMREAADTTAGVVAALPQAPGAAPTPNTTSATAPPQPSARGMHAIWDGTVEKCKTASPLEQATASWYMMCVEPPEKSAHKSNPEPAALGKQARDACGSYTRDTQQCFADFKLKVILASNPGLKETCEIEAATQNTLRRQLSTKLSGRSDAERFRACVDNIYLYGHPDRTSDQVRSPLRDLIREGLRRKDSKSQTTTNGGASPEAGLRNALCQPQNCCQPGFGMQPTPGAFGAWSCQPLGVLRLKTTRDALLSQLDNDEIADYEDRIDALLEGAVMYAITSLGSGMSVSERSICLRATLVATHAWVKGGDASVPPQCQGMADLARAQIPRYAETHVNNTNGAMEESLASFRRDIGIPLPGMIGLTPDESPLRQVECLQRTGNAEGCN